MRLKGIIKSLKTHSSHGYDDISIKILKSVGPFITSPLTYVRNKYLSSGIFPTRLEIFYSKANI
jgi:hypothetical protein